MHIENISFAKFCTICRICRHTSSLLKRLVSNANAQTALNQKWSARWANGLYSNWNTHLDFHSPTAKIVKQFCFVLPSDFWFCSSAISICKTTDSVVAFTTHRETRTRTHNEHWTLRVGFRFFPSVSSPSFFFPRFQLIEFCLAFVSFHFQIQANNWLCVVVLFGSR